MEEGCYICHRIGHTAQSCPDRGDGRIDKHSGCYICGDQRHRKGYHLRDDKENTHVSPGCFICHEEGHFSPNCPYRTDGRTDKHKGCYICGDPAHRLSRHRSEYLNNNKHWPFQEECTSCRQVGHSNFNCPVRPDKVQQASPPKKRYRTRTRKGKHRWDEPEDPGEFTVTHSSAMGAASVGKVVYTGSPQGHRQRSATLQSPGKLTNDTPKQDSRVNLQNTEFMSANGMNGLESPAKIPMHIANIPAVVPSQAMPATEKLQPQSPHAVQGKPSQGLTWRPLVSRRPGESFFPDENSPARQGTQPPKVERPHDGSVPAFQSFTNSPSASQRTYADNDANAAGAQYMPCQPPPGPPDPMAIGLDRLAIPDYGDGPIPKLDLRVTPDGFRWSVSPAPHVNPGFADAMPVSYTSADVLARAIVAGVPFDPKLHSVSAPPRTTVVEQGISDASTTGQEEREERSR